MAATKGPIFKNCTTCGERFIAGSGIAKFCSDFCHMESNTKRSDGCWYWIGGKDKDGYGIARFSGRRRVKVHRVAYEMAKGKIPEGLMVCHSCDNPGCVNPNHLFPGTALINKQDSVSKKRHVHGEAVHKAKLKEADVLAILEDGRNRQIVAAAYSVSPELIDAIRKRQIWKHLTAI